MIILLFCALFLPFLFGLAILIVLSKGKKIIPTLQLFPLAFFIGTSLFTLILFILSLIGVKWDKTIISIILGAISLIILGKFYIKEFQQILKKIFTERFNIEPLYVLLILLIIFKLFTISYIAVNKPVTDWDAWANWSLRAKVFYFEQSVNLDKNSSYYLGSGGHLDYPLQFPILEAWIFTVIGEWNDQLVKIIFPIYLISFVLFLYSFLSERITKLSALLFSFIFISLPLVAYHSSSAYIDLPLGMYLGMGTMMLLTFLKTRSKFYLILSALLLGAAAWIKNEGLLFFIITLLFAIKERANIIALLTGLIFVIPWSLFKLVEGIQVSNLGFGVSGSFLHFEILPVILKGLLIFNNFTLLWFAFILGVIANISLLRKNDFSKMLFLPMGYFFIFIFIYMFTENYTYLLNGTVLQRNLLVIAPTVFWLTALLWGKEIE